jgi:acyl-CoA dehydrogenase
MDKHIYPNEPEFFRQFNEGDRWKVIPLIEELKEIAKSDGLGIGFCRKANTAI